MRPRPPPARSRPAPAPERGGRERSRPRDRADPPPATWPAGASRSRRRRPGQRQLHHEGGALPWLTLELDGAPVGLHHLPGDVEAEPEAAIMLGRDRALEALADALLIPGGDADPAVSDRQPRPVAPGLNPEIDRLARRVLAGVGEQVGDDLGDPQGIPVPDDRAVDLQLELRARSAELRAQLLGDLAGAGGE